MRSKSRACVKHRIRLIHTPRSSIFEVKPLMACDSRKYIRRRVSMGYVAVVATELIRNSNKNRVVVFLPLRMVLDMPYRRWLRILYIDIPAMASRTDIILDLLSFKPKCFLPATNLVLAQSKGARIGMDTEAQITEFSA